MIRLALVAVCSFGAGVALMDQLQEKPKPLAAVMLARAPVTPRLDAPIMKPDMTIRHCTTSFKCGPERRYYAGMVKK
jgi:hypothetical protein